MFDRIFGNPKTTVAGIVLGIGTYIQLAPDFHSLTLMGGLTAVGTALLGLLAGDRK